MPKAAGWDFSPEVATVALPPLPAPLSALWAEFCEKAACSTTLGLLPALPRGRQRAPPGADAGAESLKLPELIAQCRSAGLPEDAIDAAMEEDRPRPALLALLRSTAAGAEVPIEPGLRWVYAYSALAAWGEAAERVATSLDVRGFASRGMLHELLADEPPGAQLRDTLPVNQSTLLPGGPLR